LKNAPDGSAQKPPAVEWYIDDIENQVWQKTSSGGCLCQLQDMIIFDFVSRNSSGCTAGNISAKRFQLKVTIKGASYRKDQVTIASWEGDISVI